LAEEALSNATSDTAREIAEKNLDKAIEEE
jgi:hypothetical protein